jgi:methylglutaconyl-CoA hydratase
MRHLRTADSGPVRTLTIARPAVHNALDERLIGELTEAVSQAGDDPSVRVIVLRGDGPSFCSGGGLQIFRDIKQHTFLECVEAGRRSAAMYHAIAHCPQPVVVAAQGAVLGGGVGLVCAGDIAIGHEDAVVRLNAVRMGLVHAIIAPYLERRVGRSEALHLCLTGHDMNAQEALRRGIFHYLTDDLDSKVDEVVEHLLLGSPEAQAATKRYFWQLPRVIEQDIPEWSAREFALWTGGDEGQEGLRAYLDNRSPNWQVQLEP